MKKRQTPYTILLGLASFFLALIIGEIGLRVIDFEFRLFPARVEFGWPDPITLEQEYELDPDLLWVRKNYSTYLEHVRDSKPSVVFMGDSCTEWGLFDKAFSKVLDIKNPGHNFSYLNLAVSGWSSYQGLKQLERDIIPLGPKAIVVYFGWNDHWASFGVEDKDVGRFNSDRSGLAYALADMRLAQLFTFFKVKLYKKEAQTRRPERVSPEDFAANLTDIIRLARANNIEPILCTAPTSHTVGAEPAYLAERWLNNLDELVPLHRRYAEIVRQVARDNEVLLVDLLAAFDRLPREEVKSVYFYGDGIHLLEEGSKIISLTLYMYLERAGLLEGIIQ